MTTAKIVERKRKMLIKLEKVCVRDQKEPADAERGEISFDSNIIESMEIVTIFSENQRKNIKVTKILRHNDIFPIYVTQSIEAIGRKCFGQY